MSEDVSKVAIRGYLPELDGKDYHDVYPFFAEQLGKATEEDENYFWYDWEKHIFVPVRDWENKKWGIEKVIFNDYPYKIEDSIIDLDFILDVKQKMQMLFPSIKQVMVCSYTWYNGSDEPISLIPTFPPQLTKIKE